MRNAAAWCCVVVGLFACTPGENGGEQEADAGHVHGDAGAPDAGGGDAGGQDAAVPDASTPLPPAVTEHLDLPDTPHNYRDELPAPFGVAFIERLDNTPAHNPVTDDGATLGRVLFFDKALSSNRTIACASCHAQETGFTDSRRFSEGFMGGATRRNSMSLTDARYVRTGRFFWDERAATLEEQVLKPIQDTVEMGLTLDELVQRVEAQPWSSTLFTRAFGDATVTTDRISRALAQYVRAVVSWRSPFDDGLALAGDVALPFTNFTAEENDGKALFLGRAGCGACHLDPGPPPQPPPRGNQVVFLVGAPVNNGLDDVLDVPDNGVGEVTGRREDMGKFKAPSLRNVEKTGPYMHDGRFQTLEQVVEFYNASVKDHPNLDGRLRENGTGHPRILNLTAAEKASLVAFMRTLTDDALLNDERFKDPFRDQP